MFLIFDVQENRLGASVSGKPPVSKTGTAGSIPAAPARFCRSPIRPEPEMA